MNKQNNKINKTNTQRQATPKRAKQQQLRQQWRGAAGPVAAAYPQFVSGGRPMYKAGGNPGSLTVTHHESLGEVLGSSTFAATYYMLIPQIFPWLTGVAQNFSRFRWKRLEFSFITSSPTSQSGHIAMGAMYDYNDTATAMTSVTDIQALAHSFMCPVWAPSGGLLGTTKFDATRWNKPWYTHHAPTTNLEYSDVFVPGWLAVGRHTQVNGQSVGHLVCSYEIEFNDPIPRKLQPTVETASMIRHSGAVPEKVEVEPFETTLTKLLALVVSGQQRPRDPPLSTSPSPPASPSREV